MIQLKLWRQSTAISTVLILIPTTAFPLIVVSQTAERNSEVRPQDSVKAHKNEADEQPDLGLIRAENQIVLKENGDKNSFKNTKARGDRDIVKIDGVRNGEKPLNGSYDVIFSCITSPGSFVQSLVFKAGSADLTSGCRVKAVIILLAYIILNKGAGTNGYSAKEIGGGQTQINIAGAKDPVTGGLFDGEYNFVYKCRQVVFLIALTVVIAKGYADQRARCTPDRDPRIYY